MSLVHDALYDAAGYAALGASSLASLYTDEDVLAAERSPPLLAIVGAGGGRR